MKATYFISDLHLAAKAPHLTQLFKTFVNRYALQADKLFILGDLFDAWIGDDNLTAFNQDIIDTLKSVSDAGVAVSLLPGNRDFLIGNAFAKACGLTLLTDPTVIELYGKKLLLLHGDSLCTMDKQHQRFRRFSHHPLTKRLYLALPLSIRRNIAHYLREQSMRRGQGLAPAVMDVPETAINHAFEYYAVKQLVHGHTHRPGIELADPEHQHRYRIVLSDWGPRGNALRWLPNGERELFYF